MAGCSKDIDTKSPVSVDDAWMYDVSLPVPVLFASPDVQTKAPITAMKQNMNIGVFGFDMAAEQYSDEDDGMNMRNGLLVVDSKLRLNLKEPFYYPPSEDKSFRFYSYYPYADSYQIGNDGKVSVEMNVATHLDILWDREDGEKGFNAKLARGGRKPQFSYSHPASCVSFYAEVDKLGTRTVIGNVTLIDVPIKARLCVADIENSENEGRFYEVAKRGDVIVSNGSTGNINVELSTEPRQLGQDMFIYPDSGYLRLRVLLILGEEGKVSRVQADYVIKPEDLPEPEEGFLPGHHYKFNLKVLSASSDLTFTVTKDSEDKVLDFDNEFQWDDAFKGNAE